MIDNSLPKYHFLETQGALLLISKRIEKTHFGHDLIDFVATSGSNNRSNCYKLAYMVDIPILTYNIYEIFYLFVIIFCRIYSNNHLQVLSNIS